MNINEMLNYCLAKPGAFEDYPFGPDATVVKVASKMFALLSVRSGKPSISLKCDPFLAQSLRQKFADVKPGYHLNKQHWNTVYTDETLPEEELLWMIDHSYELVIKSLAKAEKKMIEKK